MPLSQTTRTNPDALIPLRIFLAGLFLGPAMGGLVWSVCAWWVNSQPWHLAARYYVSGLGFFYFIGILPAVVAAAFAAVANIYVRHTLLRLVAGAVCGFLGTFLVYGGFVKGGPGIKTAIIALWFGSSAGVLTTAFVILASYLAVRMRSRGVPP
ncbi:hypothetical protein WDZ92_43165 [Nostoc sp. NIES-2111]